MLQREYEERRILLAIISHARSTDRHVVDKFINQLKPDFGKRQQKRRRKPVVIPEGFTHNKG